MVRGSLQGQSASLSGVETALGAVRASLAIWRPDEFAATSRALRRDL